MPVSVKLNQYLSKRACALQTLHHPKVGSLAGAAEILGLAGNQVAKVRPLIDARGVVLAVVPLNAEVDVDKVNAALSRSLQYLEEKKCGRLFPDCECGVLPAFGMAYGLPVIIDQGLFAEDKIYTASGCCCTMLVFSSQEFKHAMAGSIKASILSEENGSQATVYNLRSEEDSEISLESAAEKLSKLYQLPAMPAIAVKILHTVSNPDACIDDLAELVEQDPSLTAQILKYARSALFNFHGELHSVRDAINIVLGFDRVAQLAMGIAAAKAFRVPRHGPLGLDQFWRHSLYSAYLCQHLASELPEDSGVLPSEAYLAGLLHNFGILLIAHLFAPEYAMLNKLRETEPEAPMETIEKQVFGMGGAQDMIALGHGTIGGILLGMWKLPKSVVRAASMHQKLDYTGTHQETVTLVQLVNCLLAQHGIGDEHNQVEPAVLCQRLGLDVRSVQDLVTTLLEKCGDLDSMAREMAA